MKKALKITGISLLIIIFLLAAIPFIFQTQIKDMLKVSINENVNAKVEFSDVSLSLLRSFPMAQVTINDLEITNFKPFKDETFAIAKSISFTMSVRELFKKGDDEPIIVNSITVDEALIILKTDASGNTNYDIAKEAENVNSSTSESSGFSFDIEDYSINNSAFTFIDETSNTTIYITELNHSGKGIFSAETSELDTNTEAKVSFAIDSTSYLNNTYLKLDALIELDLSTNTYTFKNNKGYINELPLEFQGYVKQLEDGQEIDITFENPESSFKDFLAVIPKTYSKNLDNVTTTGDFKVKGLIKGVSSNKTIPKLEINIVSKNASFKYPDLPKRVENVSINMAIKNTTGNTNDTYIDIKTLN
ncbi:MAG: AsmA family protein, partial [Flavobacteriaceae bacterium]|nr:AsmA family protein [Flavobacteriaceae bacterium]